MKRKELIILLACIAIMALPIYLKDYMRVDILSFKFKPITFARTDTETLGETSVDVEVEVEQGEEAGSDTTGENFKSSGIFYDMGTFIVNIAHTEAQRFLKTKIALEVSDKKVTRELKDKAMIYRDTVVSVLSSKDFPEIEEKNGKDNLRREIMAALNAKLQSGTVVNDYSDLN